MPSAFLLGQCVLSAGWLFLGLASQFTTPAIASVLLVTGTISLIAIFKRNTLPEFRQDLRWPKKRIGGFWVVMLSIAGIWFIKMFYVALALQPQGDALASYMVVPKILASSHRLSPQPNYFLLSQLGLFGELHYAALMALCGANAAKLFTWFTAVASVSTLLALCRDAGIGYKGKIIAAILLATSTTFFEYAVDGKVDIYGAALGLMSYYWILCDRGAHRTRNLVLSGIFCGFATVSKLTNLPVIVPGLLCLIAIDRFTYAKKTCSGFQSWLPCAVKDSAIVACSVIIAMIPHFIKNGIWFHEPLAPFIYFGRQDLNMVGPAWYSLKDTFFLLATYPIALTFGRYPTQQGTMSPLILGFVLLAILLPRPQSLFTSRLFRISFAALLGTLAWMTTFPSFVMPRYILATLILFIPVASKSAENMLELEKGWKTCTSAILGALLLFSLMPLYPQIKEAFVWLAWKKAPVGISRDMGPYFEGLNIVNKIAAPGDRVLLVGYYSYYLRPDLLQCMISEVELRTLRRNDPEKGYDLKDASDWLYLIQRGCKFIIIQKTLWPKSEAFINTKSCPRWLQLSKLHNDSICTVFSIGVTDTTIWPIVATRQLHPQAWDIVAAK